ncbi:Sensor protein ZraS [Roseovarius litorisediminis]|uniref:histidine kinase n=1 Tax=Roseovarius litorisediminis TaxID=1312363 RepID=A0A1Y5TUA7_9RHOB|nr:ATP-binding protein [Roseovarius litorisediminis]SLN69876.1 Sensor protein ZraS [Roseovarius litorisediminis]
MPAAPDRSEPRADANALHDVVEFLDQGVAVFDADAQLTLANASFRAFYPSLSDVLKPGVPWSIFLREAVNRGVMPPTVSQRLDEMEAGFEANPTLADVVQMPSARRQVYAIKLGQLAGGGFTLTQSLQVDETHEIDAAREAEAVLRKVLEACPASLTMSRVTDGQIIYRSPAATELLGAAKSSFAHFAHAEERADFVTLLLPDASVDNMRLTCLRPDGQEFPAVISARLIDYRGEDVIVANIEDLTAELSVQAELDRQKERLFQSEKLSALGELLAGIAHELNNPLSIIVGNADILQEELENSCFEGRISKLSQAAHRCVRIVRSFLSLARQEPLDLRPVDPAKLIYSAIDAVTTEAKAAGIRISSEHPQKFQLINADEVQLIQVIINLLTNAIHAIRDAKTGGQITIKCDQSDNNLCLTISDDGPGISAEIKNRIFDPLFTTKDIGKGTGVGLAYCHRIIAAHKGRIQLESATGRQGATFSVDLPFSAKP